MSGYFMAFFLPVPVSNYSIIFSQVPMEYFLKKIFLLYLYIFLFFCLGNN